MKRGLVLIPVVLLAIGCGREEVKVEAAPAAEQKMVMVPAHGDNRPNAPTAPISPSAAANPTPDGAQPGDR